MAALAKLVVIGFIVLTVIYLCLSLYSRSVRKGKLAEWWEEEGRPGDREAYIDAGLKEYEGSLRRKLIWGVYIVPVVVILSLIHI